MAAALVRADVAHPGVGFKPKGFLREIIGASSLELEQDEAICLEDSRAVRPSEGAGDARCTAARVGAGLRAEICKKVAAGSAADQLLTLGGGCECASIVEVEQSLKV